MCQFYIYCNFKPYPTVNTCGFSRASPDGVDESDEFDHQQSYVGWKTYQVCRKLGKGNARLMGPASHKEISAGTGSNTMPVETNDSNKLLNGAEGNDHQRDQRTTGQGCSSRGRPLMEGFVSQIFLMTKKDGGRGNKPEDTQQVCEHIKMEGFHILPRLIQLRDKVRSDFRYQSMWSINTFQWELNTYHSPIWDDISYGFLQSDKTGSGGTPAHGHSSSYISGWYTNFTPVKVQLTPLICQLFKALGLVVNHKKSVLTPDQTMQFLGFQVDTVKLQLNFPVEKLRKIKLLAQHLLHQQKVTIRKIARFLVSSNTHAVWEAPAGHYSSQSTWCPGRTTPQRLRMYQYLSDIKHGGPKWFDVVVYILWTRRSNCSLPFCHGHHPWP